MFPRRMALLEVCMSCRLQDDLPLIMPRSLFGENVSADHDFYLNLIIFVFVSVRALQCLVVAVPGGHSAG